jgi:hypothetical protein
MEEYIGIALFYILFICIILLVIFTFAIIILCFCSFLKGIWLDIFNTKK